MTHTVETIRSLLLLTLLALAMPGLGGDLRLCLGGDGHVEVTPTVSHGCGEKVTVAGGCHGTDVSEDHRSCVDVVVCIGDIQVTRGAERAAPVKAALALPDHDTWLATIQRPACRIESETAVRPPPHLLHLRTVVLRA